MGSAKKEADVVLFNPAPRSGWQAQRRVELPLGLLCTATPLERQGYQIRIIDGFDNPNWKGELREALTERTLCFGLTSMTGPQIKDVLERSYRNWWWFNQGYPWGGYSHYTTCMLTTDAGNVITYAGDLATEPDGNNVVSFELEGVTVDFTDDVTTYLISTVNYVAAGSCNFNNDGVIDLVDLAALLANYGMSSGATYEDGDLNADRAVNLADLAIILGVYGMECD